MTVRDFEKILGKIREDLKDKEIVFVAPNGLDFEPKIKYRIDKPLDYSKDNVKKVVINY